MAQPIISNIRLREARNIRWACDAAKLWMKKLNADPTLREALEECPDPYWVTWFIRESIGEGVLDDETARHVYILMADHNRSVGSSMTQQQYMEAKEAVMIELRRVLLPLIKE